MNLLFLGMWPLKVLDGHIEIEENMKEVFTCKSVQVFYVVHIRSRSSKIWNVQLKPRMLVVVIKVVYSKRKSSGSKVVKFKSYFSLLFIAERDSGSTMFHKSLTF